MHRDTKTQMMYPCRFVERNPRMQMAWDLIPVALLICAAVLIVLQWPMVCSGFFHRSWWKAAIICIPCACTLGVPWVVTFLCVRWYRKNGAEEARWRAKQSAMHEEWKKGCARKEKATSSSQAQGAPCKRGAAKDEGKRKKTRPYQGRWIKKYGKF